MCISKKWRESSSRLRLDVRIASMFSFHAWRYTELQSFHDYIHAELLIVGLSTAFNLDIQSQN